MKVYDIFLILLSMQCSLTSHKRDSWTGGAEWFQ